jgi:peptide/nickel transport system substrate-binding protein
MKKNIWRLAAVVCLAAMLLASCGKTPAPSSTPVPTPAPTATPVVILPDVPADRYDAAVTPRTGNNATEPLVISTGELDGKFSPFFATNAYDTSVEGYTQLGLIFLDKKGAPQAGVEYPCLAYSYTQDVSADKSTTTYKIFLKNGITFSDGEPVTAKDVLFTYYTLCDPLYDGSSTFYTLKVQGLNEYRLQTSADTLKVADAIVKAGIKTGADGQMAYDPADGATAEQQAAFWKYFDQAGEKFTQEIVDYCTNNLLSDEAVASALSPDLTAADVKANPDLLVAFGRTEWGYAVSRKGAYDSATKTFTDCNGKKYVIGTDHVTVADYWKDIVAAYGYDLSDGGINCERAGDKRVEDYVRDLYIANEGQVAGGVASISGITSGKEACEDGVEREYIQIVCNGVDPTIIFKLGVEVAPFHYYTKDFKGTLNEYGVALNNPDFIQALKDKNGVPMGAGPYVFDKFEDNVVYFTANDGYLLGSPKIEYFRMQYVNLGSEMDAIKTDTVDFTNPTAKTATINEITEGQGDFAKLAYTLVDNDGYGYIGVNAQAVPEWDVRKALASTMNTPLIISDFYGELATLNYRTMTKVQWAYPENPGNLFPYDGTGATAKELFLKAGYKYDEAKNIMTYPDGSGKEGQQVTFKFSLPVTDPMSHPAGPVALDMQKVLEKIGVKLDIDLDTNLLNKLGTAYDSGIQMWAAAWGNGGQDPDMFQIWYSDPAMNQSDSPAAKGLYWLFQNGSDDQKAALQQLNGLITAGRSTLDVEERKVIYGQALEISTSLATEIPTYQRKNLFVFNKDVIDASSLFSGDDVTPFQSPISYIWNVELK